MLIPIMIVINENNKTIQFGSGFIGLIFFDVNIDVDVDELTNNETIETKINRNIENKI